jgi:UTP--glucose-1-phosphate uridylyltransferase
MRQADVNPAAIAVFERFYRQLEAGITGLVPEDSIEPLADPPRLDDVKVSVVAAREALSRTVIIKLNGGLGTSMGLDRAKSLLQVRKGITFLDMIAGQIRYARDTYRAKLPVLFMNSFRTREDTLEYLSRYPALVKEPWGLDFLQNAEPKLLADELTPVSWPSDPSLEWCPPGHGDLYPALWGSGLLKKMLDAGYQYLSVANGDNLGAAPDPRLAGWFAESGAPYAAEVCLRTVNDRKGGHLAIRKSDGQLILRDTAQTPAEDLRYFTDENRHRYFHCNNLWLRLESLYQALAEHDGVLPLPLIRNEKHVDPSDASTPKVIQIESAMGSAVEVFQGAQAIVVGRDRFQPVKTTNELLLLRSDLFRLGEDFRLRAVDELPEITLDPRYYKLIADFERRFTWIPSLVGCTSFKVNGDWSFDQWGAVRGSVELPDLGVPASFPAQSPGQDRAG